jgi:PAS domain S-box-containing protein
VEGSMAAFALKRGHLVVAANLGSETRFHDGFLRSRGLVAAINIPLYVEARPMGILGLYATRPRTWEQEEIVFAEMIGHLLSVNAARIWTEDNLREERQVKELMLEAREAAVLTLDAQGKIVDANQACERLTRFTLQEVQGEYFVGKMIPPAEIRSVRKILRDALDGQSAGEFVATLLAKDGTTRRLAWTLKVTGMGAQRSIVLTGIDRTEERKAIDRLRQMTLVARRAIDAVYSGEKGEDDARAGPRCRAPTDSPLGPSPSHDHTLSGGGRTGPANQPSPPGPTEHSPGQTFPPERRRSPRHTYPYEQLIAPIIEGTMPGPRNFFAVECKDLAASGIAFFLDRPPDVQQYVLSLGSPPEAKRVVCRVVRWVEVNTEGRRRCLVGCRFVGRCR